MGHPVSAAREQADADADGHEKSVKTDLPTGHTRHPGHFHLRAGRRKKKQSGVRQHSGDRASTCRVAGAQRIWPMHPKHKFEINSIRRDCAVSTEY